MFTGSVDSNPNISSVPPAMSSFHTLLFTISTLITQLSSPVLSLLYFRNHMEFRNTGWEESSPSLFIILCHWVVLPSFGGTLAWLACWIAPGTLEAASALLAPVVRFRVLTAVPSLFTPKLLVIPRARDVAISVVDGTATVV